jgi:hypothetical protein
MQYAREKTQDGRELVDFAYSVFKGEPAVVWRHGFTRRPFVMRRPFSVGRR